MRALKRGRSKEDWVPVLTVRDRGKHTFESVLPDVKEETLAKELKGKLEKDSVLCTDGHKSYISLCLNNDLVHKQLNVSAGIKVIDRVFHVQNVNAYHSRTKEWMKRFHGVPTKYFAHYLGWHRYMDVAEELHENSMLSLQQQSRGT